MKKKKKSAVMKGGEVLENRWLTFDEAVEASQIANEANIEEIGFVKVADPH